MTLNICGLNFSYDDKSSVFRDVTFRANPGEITSVIGANGAGKTTLMRCIAGQLKHKGEVIFNGEPLGHDLAVRWLSYLEQNTDCDVDLTVFEVVLLGMVHSLGFRVSPEDVDLIYSTLDFVGIKDLAGRKIGEISGGQRQLVFIAQALVKKPRILILDEPTSALDLYNQMILMDFVRDLTKKSGCVTIATLHHIDVAMGYSDRIVVLNKGEVVREGRPDDVIDKELLRDVYHISSSFVTGEDGHRHIVVEGPIR